MDHRYVMRRAVCAAGSRVLVVLAGTVTLSLTLAACDRGGRSGDTASFCADVSDNIDYLRFADFQNLDQVQTVIDLYTEIGASAPLAIEADWSALVLSLQTALDTDLDDPAAVEEMYARFYATERSAVTVVDWLRANCGVDFGPVATIVSHDPVAATPESGSPTATT